MRFLGRAIAQSTTNKDRLLLAPELRKIEFRVHTLWILGAFVVGYIADALSFNFQACDLCMNVARAVPAIDAFSARTRHVDAMRFVVLFHTLVGPVFFLILFFSANKFRHRGPWWGPLLWVVVLVVSGYGCIYGYPLGGADSARLNRMYYYFLFVSVAVSSSCWIVFETATRYSFFLYVAPIYSWFKSKIQRRA